MDASTPAEQPMNRLLGYSHYPQQCAACQHVNDVCPYHCGVRDGIAWFSALAQAIVLNPSTADATLAALVARHPHVRAATDGPGPW